jgi:hypothetical protein
MSFIEKSSFFFLIAFDTEANPNPRLIWFEEDKERLGQIPSLREDDSHTRQTSCGKKHARSFRLLPSRRELYFPLVTKCETIGDHLSPHPHCPPLGDDWYAGISANGTRPHRVHKCRKDSESGPWVSDVSRFEDDR